jgi:hypothetical protein
MSWQDIWPKRRRGARQARPLTAEERDYARKVSANKAAAAAAARKREAKQKAALKRRNKKIIRANERRLAKTRTFPRKRRRQRRFRKRPIGDGPCEINTHCAKNCA